MESNAEFGRKADQFVGRELSILVDLLAFDVIASILLSK